MILVVSAEFPASFRLHYRFIMHNYVQFGTIFNPCLGEALCLGLERRIKYFFCLGGTILLGQGCVINEKERGRSVVKHKESRGKQVQDVNCTQNFKFLTPRIFIQTENFDNSNTDGHIDSLLPIIGTGELRSRQMFCSLNPATQERMKISFECSWGKNLQT